MVTSVIRKAGVTMKEKLKKFVSLIVKYLKKLKALVKSKFGKKYAVLQR